jgi:hypothetical protein
LLFSTQTCDTNLNNTQVDVPDYFETVREDNNDVPGLVGKDYNIGQNLEVFSFFDQIAGEGKAIYESAGCPGKCGMIFIKTPLTFKLIKPRLTCCISPHFTLYLGIQLGLMPFNV